ncbi:MAG: hypothetical protein QM777_25340 [Pseudorhodoferax sp.]
MFTSVLALLPSDEYPLLTVRAAQFEDFGGVKHLSGFLRATYQFIKSERPCVSVFDGDDAGERERRDLQRFFGQKNIPFEANRQFVSVRSRFSIEGLFPDEWIKEIHEQNPSWFSAYAVDASGELEPFVIKDERKAGVGSVLLDKSSVQAILGEFGWASRFVRVFEVIDAALLAQRI